MKLRTFHMIHGILREILPACVGEIRLHLVGGEEDAPVYAVVPEEMEERLRPIVGQWVVVTDAGGSWACGPSQAYDEFFSEGEADLEALMRGCRRC